MIEFLPLSAHHDPVGRFLEETEPDRAGASGGSVGAGTEAPAEWVRLEDGPKCFGRRVPWDLNHALQRACCSEASVNSSRSHVLGWGPQPLTSLEGGSLWLGVESDSIWWEGNSFPCMFDLLPH